MIADRINERSWRRNVKRIGGKSIIDILAADCVDQCLCTVRPLKTSRSGDRENCQTSIKLFVYDRSGRRIVYDIKLAVHHGMLDKEEVLAGCEVLCVGRFEFIEI